MRRVNKLEEPQILKDNFASWSANFIADPKNNTHKYRYRHPEIKSQLMSETHSKCVHCEAKLGHNTPGDVEHKTPSSVDANEHFSWGNLTIACTECNRRKLAYYSDTVPFLDPYDNDIENRIIHLGPLVGWPAGDVAAEVSLRILALHDYSRDQLIKRKIEKIDQLNNLIARYTTATGVMRELIGIAIENMRTNDAEFSGMIDAVCEACGV